MKLCLVLSVIFLCANVNSLNILTLFPYRGKSHVDVFLHLTEGLANKGHNVTVVSYFPRKTKLPNYTDVNLNSKSNDGGWTNQVSLDDIPNYHIVKHLTPVILSMFIEETCVKAYENENLQNLLKSNQKFDVVITEFFNSDCVLGLVHKFQAPLIGMQSCTLMPWTSARFANPTHSAYIPNNFMPFSDTLSFLQRVENTVANVLHQLFFDFYTTRTDNIIMHQYLGDDVPDVGELARNSSLVLVNSHFSLNLPRPLVPNVIEVGGIHIGKPSPLPQNIEKWINESSEGVIYFSLGSMIKGHTFPQDKRQAFLKAFGRLSQRVLWKWENETMEGKPDNVMIQKWMPQFDILCHPNVKVFISHGGLLGTTEAVHCGVPIIVMPQFGDQHTNARAVEASGGGVILQLHDVTEETVYKSLKKVLSTDFRRKAKELSERFRDRPLPPLETAIYWVEYVARHRGAPHMRTAAVNMPFYKYYLIDVIAFLSLIGLIIGYINYRIARFLFRKFVYGYVSNEKVKVS